MNREYVKIVLAAAVLTLLVVVGVRAQDKPKTSSQKAPVPTEVSIPKEREDKVQLLQVKLDNIQLRQKSLIKQVEEQLKASKEWKDLEAAMQDAVTKLQVELVTAMKAAGLTEKDFDNYKYNQDTLKFTLKPADKPAEVSAKKE